MNFRSISFSQVISTIEQQLHYPITRQQKKILGVALIALAFLSACYFFRCCCFRVQPLNGPGKLTKEGKVFEGIFKDGKLDGKGTITHANGTKEEGEFKEDHFEGAGRVFAKDGTLLVDGTFHKGKLEGKATIVILDKGEFEGECVNGLPNGPGKFTYADGRIFEGGYKDGERHGKGKITEKDESSRNVEYVKGKLKNDVKADEE